MTPLRTWQEHAELLAQFVWDAFVNRTDRWGTYVPPDRRTPDERGRILTSWTAPAKRQRGLVYLSPAILAQHFADEDHRHIVGLHTTSVENTSRFLGFDIDAHDPERVDRTRENLQMTARLVAVLQAAGAQPLVEDSNGAGGLHIWVLFDEPARTRDVHGFAHAVLAEVSTGLSDELAAVFLPNGRNPEDGLAIETFPKQPAINPVKEFGNWLRLPGHHHTRAHWSRFACDGRWLDGEAGIRRFLELARTPATMLPRVPDPAPPPPVRRVSPTMVWGAGDALQRRISAYRRRLPCGLSAGQQRSDVAFNFALFLVHDCELGDRDVLGELQAWNTGNAVPLDRAKLEDTIDNAHRYHSRRVSRAPQPPAPFAGQRGRRSASFRDLFHRGTP